MMIKRIMLAVSLLTFLATGHPLDSKSIVVANETDREPIEVMIVAVGDIIVHGEQLDAQYNPETNEYDFHNNFQYVKHYIKRADIALANFETTLAGDSRPYSGFPRFNTPDSMIEALRDAGFDILSTANNHTIDTGSHGVHRTIEVIRSHGLIPVGTRSHVEGAGYAIQEVNGIRIGFASYTYETPLVGGRKTINAIPIPEDVIPLIDSFSYEDLDNDLLKIQERVNEMKEAGAEVIVFYVHWGNEYHRQENDWQRRIAQALASYGVDIIFGSHPHVLQPIQWIQNADHRTLVVYSMGNFLSNQRFEHLDTRYTEDGIIVNVTLRKALDTGRVTVTDVSYVPTWVHKYAQDDNYIYEILPLYDALEHQELFNLTTEESLWRATNSYANTQSIIEASFPALLPAPALSPLEFPALADIIDESGI